VGAREKMAYNKTIFSASSTLLRYAVANNVLPFFIFLTYKQETG
jgi:hypothetical protein